MDTTTKQRIAALRDRLEKLNQQLTSSGEPADASNEATRLEKEIAKADYELQQLLPDNTAMKQQRRIAR
jgi:hypothetical protein